MRDRIKALCKKEGITLNALEKSLKLGGGYLSKIGSSKPNAEYVQRIADYFGVSIDFLMSGHDKVEESGSAIGAAFAEDPAMLADLMSVFNSMDATTRKMWIEIGRTMANKKENS